MTEALAEVDTGLVAHILVVVFISDAFEQFKDILLVSAVEYGSHDLPAKRFTSVAEMDLEHLTDVHTGRYAQGVQNDIQRSTVGQEGHILDRQNAGDNALVTVAARHLIADRDLALLRQIAADDLVHAGLQLIAAVLAGEHLDVDNDTALAVGYAQGGISDLTRLFAEDGAQQALLGSQLGLTLGSDLTDQDIAGMDLGADVDDTVLVQILEHILAIEVYTSSRTIFSLISTASS